MCSGTFYGSNKCDQSTGKHILCQMSFAIHSDLDGSMFVQGTY